MVKIKFAKTRAEARIPTKRDEDAGYDIYACFEQNYIEIPPHTVGKIPTGIASAFSRDYCFIYKERGSTGTKNMGQRSGVIDSGYRGEWIVPISNLNDVPLYIVKDEEAYYGEGVYYPYNKAITQGILVPVPETEIEEITYEELKAISSERGEGKLGSSGK